VSQLICSPTKTDTKAVLIGRISNGSLRLTREHGERSRAIAVQGVRTDLRLTFVGLVGRQGVTALLDGG